MDARPLKIARFIRAWKRSSAAHVEGGCVLTLSSSALRECGQPANLCGKVNKLLRENIATGKFVTFFYGILGGEARTFQYCNAGHPYPILVLHGQSRILDAGGAVLGVLPTWEYEDGAIGLEPQDRLLLFTDGITKAEGANAQEFGAENVAAYAQSNNRKSAQELSNGLLARVSTFRESHFQDDATVVVVSAG